MSGPYREVLAIHDARALIGASAASQIGDWLYNAALLAYVYAETGSAGWVGAATIFRLLPYVLLGPVGGAIADRYPRRTVLLVGDLLRLAIMVGLAVVVGANGPVEIVIALTALASAAGTAERPAAIGMLPRLVGEARLGQANALLHTVQDLGVVIGPAIGAIILATASDAAAFAANGATFAVSALLISTMRRQAVPAGRPMVAGAHLAHGLRVVRATPFVLPLFAIVAMVELTYGAQTVQLVIYATQSLDLGREGYGILLTAAGVGGVLAALITGRLTMSRRVTFAIVVAGLAACATQLVYAGVDVVAIALVVTVIGSVGLVSCEVVAETTLARIVPENVLGRVVGVFEAAMVAAMVAGAVLAPVLLDATSLDASLVILGAGAVGVVLVSRLALGGLDAESGKRADALASRLAVVERLPVTKGAPQIVLERLAGAARSVALPPGVDVVVEGAPAHAFYAIAEGRVVVHAGGNVRVHLGSGDGFGERGLLDNAPRSATVTTETDTTVLRIEGDVLLDALSAAPAMRSSLDRSGRPPATTELADQERPASLDGATVVVVSAGYSGKRRLYERLAELGTRLVILDEAGHWSAGLVDEGLAIRWLPVTVVGDPDRDAAAVLATLREADVQPDGVLTFWEDSVCVVARVAEALGLPGNPPAAVDSARSKIRTREVCAELGLPGPRAKRVRSLDELYAAAAEIGFPAVVKPEFGALAVGCVRVDEVDALPRIYTLVREVVRPESDVIFRAGNDLLLEEYLDGVEFDVDFVLQDGECVFSSVSQNWPTAEPSFQETGLHCPPDHKAQEVRELVDFSVRVAQAFGFRTGVLHIEGKCTSQGPRIVEVNARMGGARIHQIVEAVWGVDLIEAHARGCLGLPQDLEPSRKPRCAVVNTIVHAPSPGRLDALPFADVAPEGPLGIEIDVEADVGQEVQGPEAIFATVLAEITLSGDTLRRARALSAELLRDPPRVTPPERALANL